MTIIVSFLSVKTWGAAIGTQPGAVKKAFGEINEKNSIAQGLPASDNAMISEIDILMATFARNNICDIIYTLYKNNDVAYQCSVNAENLQDNSWYTLSNINLEVNSGDELMLLITSENAGSGNAVTAWMDSTSEYECYRYDLKTGAAEPYDGNLCLQIVSRQKALQALNRYIDAPLPLVFLILWIFFFLLMAVLVILFKSEEPKHETHHPNSLL